MKFLGIGRALVAVDGPLSLLGASEEEEDWTLPIIIGFCWLEWYERNQYRQRRKRVSKKIEGGR